MTNPNSLADSRIQFTNYYTKWPSKGAIFQVFSIVPLGDIYSALQALIFSYENDKTETELARASIKMLAEMPLLPHQELFLFILESTH